LCEDNDPDAPASSPGKNEARCGGEGGACLISRSRAWSPGPHDPAVAAPNPVGEQHALARPRAGGQQGQDETETQITLAGRKNGSSAGAGPRRDHPAGVRCTIAGGVMLATAELKRRPIMHGAVWFTTLGIIYLVLLFTLAILSFRKGHWVLGLIGFIFPVLWIIGAILPSRRYR
jgi:hypothetical protein